MIIHHNPERGRFYAELDAGQAYLQYRPKGQQRLEYLSTFVPPEHRKHGIGAAIVKEALDYARAEGYAVTPTCPFVTRVIDRHPEYEDLVT